MPKYTFNVPVERKRQIRSVAKQLLATQTRYNRDFDNYERLAKFASWTSNFKRLENRIQHHHSPQLRKLHQKLLTLGYPIKNMANLHTLIRGVENSIRNNNRVTAMKRVGSLALRETGRRFR